MNAAVSGEHFVADLVRILIRLRCRLVASALAVAHHAIRADENVVRLRVEVLPAPVLANFKAPAAPIGRDLLDRVVAGSFSPLRCAAASHREPTTCAASALWLRTAALRDVLHLPHLEW